MNAEALKNCPGELWVTIYDSVRNVWIEARLDSILTRTSERTTIVAEFVSEHPHQTPPDSMELGHHD